jgi:hypothetical protein
MKIYDIPQATKITINMVHKDKSYNVEATVLTRYGDGILITPIHCGEEKIDFCSNANFEYTENYSGIKHTFHADTISRVDFAGSDFHVITGREIIISDNQRKAERFTIEIMGGALTENNVPMSIVVHDISMRGFSLLVGKNSSLKVGERVRVSFHRKDKAGRITMNGVVVRKFKTGGYDAVGCELEATSPLLLGFIMDKKSEKVKAS